MGLVTYSKIGVISKEKAGKQKLRLIHDLRRSGVNEKVQFKERAILPRIEDAIRDVLKIIRQVGATN